MPKPDTSEWKIAYHKVSFEEIFSHYVKTFKLEEGHELLWFDTIVYSDKQEASFALTTGPARKKKTA